MQDEPVRLVLYGAAGYAMAMRDMLVQGFRSTAFDVVAYIDDFRGDTGIENFGIPVITFETWLQTLHGTPCLIGVGNPTIRRQLAGRIADAGGSFGVAYEIGGPISPDITVGGGTVIGAPTYIGPCTIIGQHVQIMPMGAIGHDVTIGDFVTICSSVSVGGQVVIEDDVFLGVGAVVVNGTRERPLLIGRGATVGAGAVVTKSVRPGARVAGNPARELRVLAGARLRRNGKNSTGTSQG
jgi:sugar O-acyltransferase (sialic acid O-acetyltransferase NeuD family)